MVNWETLRLLALSLGGDVRERTNPFTEHDLGDDVVVRGGGGDPRAFYFTDRTLAAVFTEMLRPLPVNMTCTA